MSHLIDIALNILVVVLALMAYKYLASTPPFAGSL